jgi:hypothetical protein
MQGARDVSRRAAMPNGAPTSYQTTSPAEEDGRSDQPNGSGFVVWDRAMNPSHAFLQPLARALHAQSRPFAAHPGGDASGPLILTAGRETPPPSGQCPSRSAAAAAGQCRVLCAEESWEHPDGVRLWGLGPSGERVPHFLSPALPCARVPDSNNTLSARVNHSNQSRLVR